MNAPGRGRDVRRHFQRISPDAAVAALDGTMPGERLELRFRIEDMPAGTRPPATTTPKTTTSTTPTSTTTKPATDKPATTKPATDKPATDKPATDKPATDKPAADKPATTKPTATSPTVDGRRPGSGSTDGRRAATRTTTTADRAERDADQGIDGAGGAGSTNAAGGASGSGGAQGPSTTSASAQYDNEQRRAEDREREHQRSAAVLDQALTPAEIKRLQAEQEAFFGTDPSIPTQGGGTSKPGPKPVPKSDGKRTPGDTGGAGSTGGADGSTGAGGAPGAPIVDPQFAGAEGGGSKGDDKDDKDDKPLPEQKPQQSPAPSPMPTHEEQLEFFRDRDYWIAPNGEVWRVEVLADQSVQISRHDDEDGNVASGLQFANAGRRPVSLPPSAGGGATGGGTLPPPPPLPTIPKGGGSTGDTTKRGSTTGSGHVADEEADSDWAIAAPTEADYEAQFDAATGTAGGKGTPAPTPGGPPESSIASGTVYLLPDGRFIESTRVNRSWEDGSTQLAIERRTASAEPNENGYESMVLDQTRLDDGSSASVRRTNSIGVYAPESNTGGVVIFGHVFGGQGAQSHERTQVTITDPNGRRVSTDSDRPSTRATPTTLDELRAAQDELSLAYQGMPDGVDAADSSRAHAILTDATFAMADIDRAEIERSVHAGARQLAASDPELVTQFGDEEFGQVRDAFAGWGLDAADGNELIARDWYDESIYHNAHYDPGEDKMEFGLGDDAMPYAMGSDVIAHEFTHRVISKNGGINYQGESGAINESLADTMAAALDQDWIVGEDVIEHGIRDMSREVTIDDFVVTTSDHGGVHSNSAIPNHAAYLIGEDVGRDKMGAIYARTMDNYLSPDMDFRDLAQGTWQAAQELYGRDSAEARAVQQAWEGVLLVDDGSLWNGGRDRDGGTGAGGGGHSGGW
jgi:hypothetical protein